MLLSEIFDQLTYGELKDLSIGGKKEGSIQSEDYPQIISYINLALTELYKRHPIKIRTIPIQMYAAIGTYYLDSSYSAITGTQDTLYLIDTATEPFVDNVLKITKVFDEDGDLLPFNNVNEITSIDSYDYNAITVPNPDSTKTITVEYRADHDPISATELDPTTVTIPLPRSLMEALLNYVAYRAYASTPPLDGVDRSGMYLQKFENSIQRISNLDLVNDVEKHNQKLGNDGWP